MASSINHSLESLTDGGYLPERCPEHLLEVLSNSSTQEFAIDGTERKRQRPGNYEGRTKTVLQW